MAYLEVLLQRLNNVFVDIVFKVVVFEALFNDSVRGVTAMHTIDAMSNRNTLVFACLCNKGSNSVHSRFVAVVVIGLITCIILISKVINRSLEPGLYENNSEAKQCFVVFHQIRVFRRIIVVEILLGGF